MSTAARAIQASIETPRTNPVSTGTAVAFSHEPRPNDRLDLCAAHRTVLPEGPGQGQQDVLHHPRRTVLEPEIELAEARDTHGRPHGDVAA